MYSLLNKHRSQLTKQQFKTIKGQIVAGDYVGARKGLKKLLNKKKVENEK